MVKFLGIDYGLERTGLALTDPEGKIPFPLATLRLKDFGSRADLLAGLCGVANSNAAEVVVIGLPLHTDGTENITCRQVRNFTARLKRRLAQPIFYMPEILSSQTAENDLRQAGIKLGKLKAVLDQQAACVILSSFLAQPESKWMRA